MSVRAYVRPGKMVSVIAIIAGCGMLLFGSSFLGGDDSSIFMVFWNLILIIIIGYNVYNLISRKASSVATNEIDLDLPDSKGKGTVEEKLRSLERLKKEQLITEKEYLQKRKEIMQQKW
jgi:amino acid permease